MANKDQEDIEQEDIEIRILKLKRQAEKQTDGHLLSDTAADCSVEVEEQFWKNVVAFEQATWNQPFQVLIESGISLPSSDELDDRELSAKLWEVIHALAILRVYLHNTDHLSDRELYVRLWSETLREEIVMQPNDADFACCIDMVGSGSEEDIEIYLKYYADEEERQHWAKEWPNGAMPEPERHPFDRDRRLPQSRQGEEFSMQ
jgi:hypothetical protein